MAMTKNVEAMVLIPCGYDDGVMFPASLASQVLPVIRKVKLEYGQLPKFREGPSQLGSVSAVECTVISADTVTAMLVAERMATEEVK